MGPLRTRRLSRRLLFTDLGAAGLGLMILNACGSSSNDSAGTDAPTDPPATDPPATDAPPAATEPPATDAPPTTAAPADTEAPAAGDGALQLGHVSLGFVSAYVLVRGSEAAIVDTGTPGSAPMILDGLSMLGSSWSNVGHVILTHNHGDHIGGLSDVIAEAPGAMLYGGEADLAAITVATPVMAVADGDEVFGMGVISTPGHTPGSISVFDTATGILVAGDAINGENGMLTGPNPDFSSDMGAAVASVAKLAALQPTVAAFGHGGAPIDTDVTAQLAALAAG